MQRITSQSLLTKINTTKLFMLIFIMGLLSVSANNVFAYNYATDAIWSGTTNAGSQRSDPQNALGSKDGDFLSLGLGGKAVFDFGTNFTGTVEIVEVTWGRDTIVNYLETADVYVGNNFTLDLSEFTYVSSITNNTGTNEDTNLLDISSLGNFKYLLILDTTPTSSRSTDGFDIDSVGVTPVPVPGAIWLLGSGLLGLVGIRRRNG